MAERAASAALPSHPVLKTAAQFTLIGKPMPGLEAAAKHDGSAVFGIDVVLPGMRYASVLMCPTLGGQVASASTASRAGQAARREAGAGGGRLARRHGRRGVIADTPWQALAGAFKAGGGAPGTNGAGGCTLKQPRAWRSFGQGAGRRRRLRLLQHRRPEGRAGSRRPRRSGRIQRPLLAHATMEPQNCTVLHARSRTARATVWAPTQVPGLARRAAAKALGMDAEQVA
jgi:isoquinoline 1-oxidoreductase beta subunit